MTVEAQPIAIANRGFLWWLSVILAPIGLFGGPIEIANMVSGLVEWRGPIGYAVNFWSENVSVHFANLFGLLTGLFNIAPLSDLVVSYLTLGILLCTSLLRASTLLGVKISPMMLIFGLLPGIFAWPAAVFSAGPAFLEKKSRGPATLILAPFLIFVGLWIVNALWA
jgi:hypothetical protein